MDPDEFFQSKLKVLNSFDSNIKIYETLKSKSKEKVQLFIDRRLKDAEADCLDDDFEKVRAYNLLSVLYFTIKNFDEALRYNENALVIDDRSINALVCRTYFYLRQEEYDDCEQVFERLTSLQFNNFEKLQAKAEVAYSYTKIGIEYFQNAIEYFETILSDCNEIPAYHVCSWKYIMALTVRRQLNLCNSPPKSSSCETNTNFQTVEMLYKEIISMTGDNIKRYKARACVDLGLEIYFRRNIKTTENEKKVNEANRYIDKALNLEPNDDFVLSRSGKFYRLIGQHLKSIDLLTKALQVKETSFSHHHLALALKIDIQKMQKGTDVSMEKGTTVMHKHSSGHLASGTLCPSKNNYTTLRHKAGSTANSVLTEKEKNFAKQKQNYTLSPAEFHMRKLVKSPRKVCFFPPDKITDIMKHLDRAFELNDNLSALYDKGLILRASKQYAKAVDVFKTITQHSDSSKMQLANAYEQAALCLLEEEDSKRKNDLKAKMFLSQSLTISCELVKILPVLHRSWGSYPTLRSLLLSQPRTKDNLKALANLYKITNQDYKAVHLLERILQTEEDENEKVVKELVENYLRLGHYHDAIFTMRLILCQPEGKKKIDTALYIKAYIEGGIDAWSNDERPLAEYHFITALYTPAIWRDGETKETGEHHLYILSSPDSEEVAGLVCKLLRKFGLSVTFNSDDVIPGQMEKSAMQKIMDTSEYIAVFLSKDEKGEDILFMQQWFTEDPDRKIDLIIDESDRAKRDPIYRCLPSVPFERSQFDDIEYVTQEQILWVKKLLLTLIENRLKR